MFNIKININVDIIAREARDTQTLMNGELLYSKKGITDVSFFTEKSSFQGTVNDNGVYHSVSIRFNSSGNLVQYRCTCNQFTRDSRACTHIVALMKLIFDNQHEINDRLKSSDKVISVWSNGVLKKSAASDFENVIQQARAQSPIFKDRFPLFNSTQTSSSRFPSLNTQAASSKAATKPVDTRRGAVIEFNQMKIDNPALQESKPLKLTSDVDKLFKNLIRINSTSSDTAIEEKIEIKPEN